ncbi:MAG: DNA repair protein RecO [Candidatus Omnitrophota bacterium]|jgi:DNA repair protein RecO (recombination protein O)
MPILRTNAIILRRFNFRETSLIVSFLTEEFGKISGLLKGIRKDPRKFASTVEPFSHNEIIFYKSRHSTLHLVSQCDIKENFNPLRHDLSRVGTASVMMELADAVMPDEDKNTEVFDLTVLALTELAVNPKPEKIGTIFKIKLLSLSGFKPHLDSCIFCANQSLGQAKFSMRFGGLLCERCSAKDAAARAILKGTIATILFIERNDFKNTLTLGMNFEVKKEIDLILDLFIRFHIEKDLKSQKVLKNITKKYEPRVAVTC